ncbi:MAG: hypothetical protein RI922_40 [Bacteroidota bacterium]
MNKFFYYIDKYKYAIVSVFTLYTGIFVYLQLVTYSRYFPIQPFFEKSEVNIVEDELELTPDNLEIAQNHMGGEVKNTSRDVNDTRQRSEDNWYANKSTGDVEKAVKDYEKSLYSATGGEAKRAAIQKEMDERRKQNTSTNSSNSNSKGSNSTPGGNTAAAGNVMVDWSLSGRSPHQNNSWYVRNPGYTCGYGSSGRVSVQIFVNQNGDVVNATATGSSGANDCMIQQALKYAKLSRFNYSGSAPKSQTGTIVYTFVGQ